MVDNSFLLNLVDFIFPIVLIGIHFLFNWWDSPHFQIDSKRVIHHNKFIFFLTSWLIVWVLLQLFLREVNFWVALVFWRFVIKL